MVVGQPSAVMATRLEEEEKARIAQQKEKMGKDGLDEAERVLEAAKREHDKEIPTKVLTDFPVPDVKSIAWIPVQSLQEVGVGAGRRRVVEQRDNAELEAYVANDGDPVPFFVQYDQVEVSALSSASEMTRTHRSILVKLYHCWSSSVIGRNTERSATVCLRILDHTSYSRLASTAMRTSTRRRSSHCLLQEPLESTLPMRK